MIDWLSFRFPLSAVEHALVGRIFRTDQGGALEWQTLASIQATGSFDSSVYVRMRYWDAPEDGAISARAVRDGVMRSWPHHFSGWCLEISGSPAKFLQGHNVFGGSDVRALCCEMARQVVLFLVREGYVRHEALDRAQLEWAREGHFWLTRVDLNASLAIGDASLLDSVFRGLSCCKLAFRKRDVVKVPGRQSVSWGPGSSYWWLKAYGKAVELEKHVPPARETVSDELYARLLDFASPLLRVEVQLNALYLDAAGLRLASSWDSVDTFALLREFMAKVEVSGAVLLDESQEASMPPALQLVYDSWRRGRDMKKLLSLRTFYRRRKELLAYGVDIGDVQARVVEAVPSSQIDLREIWSRPFVGVPDWAKGTPLYFEPSTEGLTGRDGSLSLPLEPPSYEETRERLRRGG